MLQIVPQLNPRLFWFLYPNPTWFWGNEEMKGSPNLDVKKSVSFFPIPHLKKMHVGLGGCNPQVEKHCLRETEAQNVSVPYPHSRVGKKQESGTLGKKICTRFQALQTPLCCCFFLFVCLFCFVFWGFFFASPNWQVTLYYRAAHTNVMFNKSLNCGNGAGGFDFLPSSLTALKSGIFLPPPKNLVAQLPGSAENILM